MPTSRRLFLAGISSALLSVPASASSRFDTVALRGSLDAGDAGLIPDQTDDQSRILQAILDRASERDEEVFLPAGQYRVGNIRMPARARLYGVAGATRLVFGGGATLMAAGGASRIVLDGLTFDGANRTLDTFEGLVDLRDCADVTIRNCSFTGSGKHGLYLERCGGRIADNTISGAVEAALWSVDATGLAVTGNTITDCANGGIWIHRWQPGHDGSIVSGNRIARIGSTNGGTGQWGNGINVFRAGNVLVNGNTVEDCAFSAIRSNSGDNIQITANHTRRSGETGIYAEFAFEGAVIASNVVDGATNGISVVNFNEGGRLASVSGNLVRNLKSVGPYPPDDPGFGTGIAIEADTACTGNVIENAPLYGIAIGWGEFMRDVVATGNVIRGAKTGIAITVVEGTGKAVVTDNVIADVSDVAIGGYRWTERVTDDLATSGRVPPNLTVARNALT